MSCSLVSLLRVRLVFLCFVARFLYKRTSVRPSFFLFVSQVNNQFTQQICHWHSIPNSPFFLFFLKNFKKPWKTGLLALITNLYINIPYKTREDRQTKQKKHSLLFTFLFIKISISPFFPLPLLWSSVSSVRKPWSLVVIRVHTSTQNTSMQKSEERETLIDYNLKKCWHPRQSLNGRGGERREWGHERLEEKIIQHLLTEHITNLLRVFF